MNQTDLIQMADNICQLRQTTEALRAMGKKLPAVDKNTARILASIKMLELNICDPAKLIDP